MEFACYDDWRQLPSNADALFAKTEKESLFFSRPWFKNLAEHAPEDGRSFLLVCVIEDDHVLAILPLLKLGNGHWRSLGHLYSSLFTLLLAKNRQQAILTCLVQGLSQLPAYSLRLEPVAENDANLQSLQAALESSGFFCERYFRFYNWIHRLQGQSFADYMAARPSRVRNTIARKQRKLEREHGYNIRLYIDGDLRQAKIDYNAAYQASWKANELFGGFVEGLADNLAERGWLRLAVLYIKGKPVAAQFWFVAHGKASIFKLAYDDAWKRYSPGSILIAYLMEYVIDTDKVEEIDFLTGNDAYKCDWMSERRERWGLYCAKVRQPKGKINRLIDVLRSWMHGLNRPDDAPRSPWNSWGRNFKLRGLNLKSLW